MRVGELARLYATLLTAALALSAADPYSAGREAMVRDQIEARGVENPAVLKAMRSTPRHLFVPEELRSMAYRDHPLPIGHGATISQPYIVAVMTDLLNVSRSHRVLEIGTGSGYQAAVLSRLSRRVYTVEIVAELAADARARLRDLGYSNVVVRHGDGYLGWPEEAPFDRIILTAGPLEVPAALIDQLAPGGILVAPVGPQGDQRLVVAAKTSAGAITTRTSAPVLFVQMQHGPR